MTKLLPWIEAEVAKIKKLNITIDEKLDLLFKKVPGICRFKAEQLPDEVKRSFIKTFQLKPSLSLLKRKLNRRK